MDLDVNQEDGADMGDIVVGIDGSEGSLTALRWAADEARARGARLRVLTAWHVSAVSTIPAFGVGQPTDEVLAELRRGLDRTLVEESLGGDRGPEVVAEVVAGHPAAALLEASDGAELLVVGSRGHGGLAGALLGSTSQHVVQHAPVPVVVVPTASP